VSFDGVGPEASFMPFNSLKSSGAALAVVTDKTTSHRYLVVAEGAKSKLRSIALPNITALPPSTVDPDIATTQYAIPFKIAQPSPATAVVDTLTSSIYGPRKISAGDGTNLYAVSSHGSILDMNLRSKLTCDAVRKVFPTVLRNNPSYFWKSHFGFDKWFPDTKDISDGICDVTDECKGQTDSFNPVCKCPSGMKSAEMICDKPLQFDKCATKACSKMGCMSVGLKGNDKVDWANGWWAGLNNPTKIIYSSGWEHYPVQKLQKTMKYCLHKPREQKPENVGLQVDKRIPGAQLLQNALDKATEQDNMSVVDNECGVFYGSWWKFKIMKEVQMIRHMCGPGGTPAAHCPVAYLIKTITCNQEMMHRGATDAEIAADVREPQEEVCCIDKKMERFLTPRLENVAEPVDLPGDLKEQALEKLEAFTGF